MAVPAATKLVLAIRTRLARFLHALTPPFCPETLPA
jgi:hypothetical protein